MFGVVLMLLMVVWALYSISDKLERIAYAMEEDDDGDE